MQVTFTGEYTIEYRDCPRRWVSRSFDSVLHYCGCLLENDPNREGAGVRSKLVCYLNKSAEIGIGVLGARNRNISPQYFTLRTSLEARSDGYQQVG